MADIQIPVWLRSFVKIVEDPLVYLWEEPEFTGETTVWTSIWFVSAPPACYRVTYQEFYEEWVTFGVCQHTDRYKVDIDAIDEILSELNREINRLALEQLQSHNKEAAKAGVQKAVENAIEHWLEKLGEAAEGAGSGVAGTLIGMMGELVESADTIEITLLLERLAKMQSEADAIEALDGRIVEQWTEEVMKLKQLLVNSAEKREKWPCDKLESPSRTWEISSPRKMDIWNREKKGEGGSGDSPRVGGLGANFLRPKIRIQAPFGGGAPESKKSNSGG